MVIFSSSRDDNLQNINNHIVDVSNESLDRLFANIESIESKMFDCMKYQYYRYYVRLSNNVRIWTISNVPPPFVSKTSTASTEIYTQNKMQAEIDESKEPLLLLHGFMASAGFWILNLDSLTQSKHPVYAIDLPGYSRSSRIHLGSNPLECENNYVNVLEEFVAYFNFEKITLIGHSMGGFLASAYSIHNSHQIKNLLLIDPWGYEDIKELIVNNLSNCDWITIIKELFNWRHYFRFIGLVISPYSYFSLFRTFGEAFTVKCLTYTHPSFRKCYSEIVNATRDDQIMYKYIHRNTACEYNNGEQFMPLMCVCLGWSLRPMLPRIIRLKNSREVSVGSHSKIMEDDAIESHSNNTEHAAGMQILFVYGEKSWVRKYPGYFLQQARPDLRVKVKVIKNVGHQVVFEDPDEFLSSISEYL